MIENAMAVYCAPLPPAGGYECDFVDPVPDSLSCAVCLLPFRDPHLVTELLREKVLRSLYRSSEGS